MLDAFALSPMRAAMFQAVLRTMTPAQVHAMALEFADRYPESLPKLQEVVEIISDVLGDCNEA